MMIERVDEPLESNVVFKKCMWRNVTLLLDHTFLGNRLVDFVN